MIARLIRWSIVNRFLVLLATLMLTAWGVWSLLGGTIVGAPAAVRDGSVVTPKPFTQTEG